jgi:hypothetical protein
MKRTISLAVIAVFLVCSLSGCATTSETGQKTAVGATIGAIMGGAIGFATTGDPRWAAGGMAIGAAAGGLTGFMIGKYEEDQVQSRQQVYAEYPEYSYGSSEPTADVKDLMPQLLDRNNFPVSDLVPGQTIKMVSEYTVVASPGATSVEVEENNYLVRPDGSRTPDTTRIKMRNVQRVVAKQVITLPKKLAPGTYTHVAVVRIGNRIVQSEQFIEVSGAQ